MSKKEVKFTEESAYKTTISYICPKRGKVTQEVLVRKFSPQEIPEMKSTDSTISDLLNSAIEIEDID